MSPGREQGGKVFILKDRPQGIPERQRGMAFGKGRAGNTGGFVRHRLKDVRWESVLFDRADEGLVRSIYYKKYFLSCSTDQKDFLTQGMLTPPWNPSTRFPAPSGGA